MKRTSQAATAIGIGVALVIGWRATRAQESGAHSPPPTTNAVNGASANTERGFGIFQAKCLNCHGRPGYESAPSPAALREMTPEHIYSVLTDGVMFPVIGKDLSDADRRVVAEMISGRLMGTSGAGAAANLPNRCPDNPPIADPASGSAWNGWGRTAANTRFQPDPGRSLNAATVSKLKLKWAFGFPGGSSAYSQPTVVSGRVFVGSDTGVVYALDAGTGCVHWTYRARAGVRSAVSVGPVGDPTVARYTVFFGDLKSNVYALDAQTGRELWTRKVEQNFTDRVTASPTLYDGRLYVPISSFEEYAARTPTYGCCTSVGEIVALDAASGRVLWNRYVIDQRPRPTRINSRGVQQYAPAGGSVWNTPAVDPKRRAIYFGTGDATTDPAATTSDSIMALDMDSGRRLWSYQVQSGDAYLVGCQGAGRTDNCPKVEGPDFDISTSAILTTAPDGRRLILVGTKSGEVLALDPDRDGALVWRAHPSSGPAPAGASGRPRWNAIFWGGAADREMAYYGLIGGGLAALRLSDGQEAWWAPLDDAGKAAPIYAPATEIPGVVFAGAMNGELFAVSTSDGRVLWRFDTARRFPTVDQVPAAGGSIGSAGPVVAGDMLLVGSGYSITSAQPGNVLLAFGLDGAVERRSPVSSIERTARHQARSR